MTTTAASTSAQSSPSGAAPASKPLAVVTGASSGIGLELAKQFAQNGFDLFLTADDSLGEARTVLGELGADVSTHQADLTDGEAVDALADAVLRSGRPVDALALNAGVGIGGPFVTTSWDDDRRLLELNVVSTVHLAKRLVPGMVERGQGRVLFTSSVAAIAPAPNQAIYGGSKSFLQSFAEALRQEIKGSGVTVTALMPGPTETNFFSRAGLEHTALGAMKKDDAETVAQQGFAALMAGREKVVAGSALTRVQGQMMKAVPDSVKAALQGLGGIPGSARKLPNFLKK